MGPDGAGWSMGQVLGFSHCKEFGSVSTTPDSTPSSTEGGNEESDFPELQTARDWSEDEEGEGGRESPSVWGTPRQNSYELTFSYIAFADTEGTHPRRDSSAGGGRRQRRGRPGGLSRTDTTETLLPDSPQAEPAFPQWDPAFSLNSAEEEERQGKDKGSPVALHGVQPSQPPSSPLERRLELRLWPERAAGLEGHIPDAQTHDTDCGAPLNSSPVPLHPTADTIVSTETTTLLTAVLQGAGHADASSSFIGQNTQEEPISEQWFTALSQSESPARHVQVTAVSELIYWKDAQKTGVVFTGLVVSLIALSQLSIISVVSNLAFAIICVTITLRLYYKTLHALNKSDGANPFQWYLDYDISLSKEQSQRYMDRAILMGTSATTELRKLFLVDDVTESFKFALLMYLLTYIGAVFNGLTLLIIAVICAFSLPMLYRQHQAQVDQYVGLVTGLLIDIRNKIQAKIPSAKPKEE
ncbi:reticulon-2a [Amia ocellicauda]|uniref:reticulon-2a n=1 Tax=Amia ocellicauda TaxID=2972642 RepID=UPI0034639BBC